MKWPLTALGDLALLKGGSVDPSKYPEETFELYSIPAYDAGAPEISQASEIGSSKKAVEPNDVMISRIVPHIRRSWIVGPKSDYRQIASGEWIIFRSPDIFPNYLRQLLLGDVFNAAFMRTVAGVGGSLLRARPPQVYKIQIPLPPLEEQKRIAGILDAADILLAKRREALSKLDDLLQSTFLDLFGDPVTNPKGWEVKSLGELATNEDGKRVPVKKADREAMDGEYPYYGASGIIDYVNDYLFEGERLLIGEDGANLVARSTPIAFMAKGKYWVNNHAHVLASNGKSELLFLEAFVNAIDLKPFLSGTAQPKLNQKKLNQISVPTPPLDLQQRFAEIVSTVEEQKARMREHLEQLDDLFASLQQRAFRGDL